MSKLPFLAIASCVLALGCGSAMPVYPPRPSESASKPIADPTPSRVVLHATITGAALRDSLEQAIPRTGQGTFPMLGSDRQYTWRRGNLSVRFHQGRIAIDVHVDANADLPVSSLDVPIDVSIYAEPIVSSEYQAKLQSIDVTVQSEDRVIKAADAAADILPKIKSAIRNKLQDFSQDLFPTMAEAHHRLKTPIPLPLGDAEGCATLDVVGIEAGPTVLADGFEKDLAMVVLPSVTIPCSPPEGDKPLPRLANVATLPTGPFTVVTPIAARYEELTKAMSMVFTDGKLFFSKEHPKIYLEKPEIYSNGEKLVLKMHIGGPVEKYGINAKLDGDLYLAGTPVVVDNELSIPDLEPTIETSSFLLGLKAAKDGDEMKKQARAALRLDISERLKAVREKLSTDMSFAGGTACVKAQVHKIEVSSVFVHATYMRLYVTTSASASMFMPCN
ncbi:MAG TPA: DUF4403 family protein [Polyangium sp.]|nr:DUF4403 family protein [Polyangium sp.]